MLAATEIWISFSYYGMQSLVVLYMACTLLRLGHVEHVLGFDAFHSAWALAKTPEVEAGASLRRLRSWRPWPPRWRPRASPEWCAG